MLSFEYVSECLSYNPDSGDLTWKKRPRKHFKTKQAFLAWNAKYAGGAPGWLVRDGKTTYLSVCVGDKEYRGHRLCWLLHHGKWPENGIDHIDGCGTNNRITNLRDVSHAENMRNQRKSAANTSGVTGVSWHKTQRKWKAKICLNGKDQHIGTFETLLDAAAARKRAEREYGFHENHGIVKIAK